MDEAQGCSRSARFHNQPFKSFCRWNALLKSQVKRPFHFDKAFACQYCVCLHLRADHFDFVALLFSQTNLISKFEKMRWPRNAVKLRCSGETPSATTRDLL